MPRQSELRFERFQFFTGDKPTKPRCKVWILLYLSILHSLFCESQYLFLGFHWCYEHYCMYLNGTGHCKFGSWASCSFGKINLRVFLAGLCSWPAGHQQSMSRRQWMMTCVCLSPALSSNAYTFVSVQNADALDKKPWVCRNCQGIGTVLCELHYLSLLNFYIYIYDYSA